MDFTNLTQIQANQPNAILAVRMTLAGVLGIKISGIQLKTISTLQNRRLHENTGIIPINENTRQLTNIQYIIRYIFSIIVIVEQYGYSTGVQAFSSLTHLTDLIKGKTFMTSLKSNAASIGLRNFDYMQILGLFYSHNYITKVLYIIHL